MKTLLTLTAVCSISLLAACSSTPKATMAVTEPAATTQPTAAAPSTLAPVAESKVQAVVLPPYLDPASALSTKRSVYFDYDNFAVKPEFQSMLDLHGKYLAKNPKLSIRVEGNADERGTKEYNFALGARRAEAVSTYLVSRGVVPTRISTISYGKENPIDSGTGEVSWAKNRNAHTSLTSGTK